MSHAHIRARLLAVAGTLAVLLSLIATPGALAVSYRDCDEIALEPGADLHRCDFAGSSALNGHDLSGANLLRANLTGARVGGNPDAATYLTNARLRHVTASGADFSEVFLGNADLRYADLSNGSFEDAYLAGANLGHADLSGADFFFATLAGANLRHADFSDASLRFANLTNADLRYAKGLASANLEGVNWDNTRCPDRTNSDTNGGTCLGHL